MKKILACIMAMATLGIVTAIPTSADVIINDTIEDSITTEYDDVLPYYELPQDFSIRDVFEDENHILVVNNREFTLVDVSASDNNLESQTYFTDGKFVYDGDEDDLNVFTCVFTSKGETWYYNGYVNQEKELATENKTLKYSITISTANPTVGNSEDNTINLEFPYSIDDESKTVVYDNIKYGQLSNSDAHYYDLPDDFDIQKVIDGNGVLQLNGKKFTLKEVYIYGPSLDDPILDVYNLYDDDGNGYMYTKSYKETSANQLLEGTEWVLSVDSDNVYTINYITKTVISNEEATLQRGDVNGDGTIDAVDLLQLKKYLLGIIDSLD